MTTIRPATAADGQAMLELIETHPAQGGMRLLYTRRPDAYQSYLAECPEAVAIVQESSDGRLQAQAVCLPRRLYINGQEQTCGYITGLHKADGAWANILRILEAGYQRLAVDQYFCSILADNNSVLDMFEKRGLIHMICEYRTYLLSPRALPAARRGSVLRPATPADAGALLRFYAEEGARYSYFPVIEGFTGLPALAVGDFFLLEDASGIAAAGALWDQRSYKQYIALGYEGAYRVAARLGPLLRLLRYPALPPIGQAADFAYLSFALARGGDDGLLCELLGGLAEVGQVYGTLVIGAVAGSELDGYLASLRGFSFDSRICNIEFMEIKPTDAFQTPLRLECGLL